MNKEKLNKIYETFLSVKLLLDEESKWCKGHLALNRADNTVSIHNPTACVWSLTGAIVKCTKRESMVTSSLYGDIDAVKGFLLSTADDLWTASDFFEDERRNDYEYSFHSIESLNDAPGIKFIHIEELLNKAISIIENRQAND